MSGGALFPSVSAEFVATSRVLRNRLCQDGGMPPGEGTVMSQPITSPESSKILRASLWVAIGALIAAALVCVVWVLIGDDNGIIGKAFLTILLLAGAFAGVAIIESQLASRRPAWLALTSMVAWVLTLLIGAFLIWMPTSGQFGVGAERFFRFVLIVLIIQGALLHVRLFAASLRHQTTFTTVVTYVTIGLVGILAVMPVVPLVAQEAVDFRPLYWRVVVALAILAAVGTAPRPARERAARAQAPPRPAVSAVWSNRAGAGTEPSPLGPLLSSPMATASTAQPYAAQAPLPWPTFADAVTPLPALPDGSPDWKCATRVPSHPQHSTPALPAAASTSRNPAPRPGTRAIRLRRPCRRRTPRAQA